MKVKFESREENEEENGDALDLSQEDDATLPCNQTGLKQRIETLATYRLFHRILAQVSHIS